MYYYKTIIGIFILDENMNIIKEIPFKHIDKYTEEADSKYEPLPEEYHPKILELLKQPKYFKGFYENNVALTKQGIKQSVNEDDLIIQAISNIEELDKISNMLTKRLREWYSLYLPELSENLQHHEKFVELVLEKSKKELLKELETETMGADLSKDDVDEIILVAKEVNNMYTLRKKHEEYLSRVMEKYCPNVKELCGTTIGAKLLDLARSLKRLATLPSSTVQLLGAEKALFRHMKNKSSLSPKYGVIFQHPLIQKVERKARGKAARSLADKISLCARLDFFKGEFKAPKFREELEQKFVPYS
ncbi:MAG: hypothetical protein CMH61_01405 [Nanoarchaeota archaeon]|nr:hypothetical protein [Nanoarchaeota archaeon]